jgi:hypothetical protein
VSTSCSSFCPWWSDLLRGPHCLPICRGLKVQMYASCMLGALLISGLSSPTDRPLWIACRQVLRRQLRAGPGGKGQLPPNAELFSVCLSHAVKATEKSGVVGLARHLLPVAAAA